jgi:hypothetical protein
MYHTFSPVLRLLEIEEKKIQKFVSVHQWSYFLDLEKYWKIFWQNLVPGTAFRKNKVSAMYHIRDLTVNLFLAYSQVPYNVTPLFVREYPRILRDISWQVITWQGGGAFGRYINENLGLKLGLAKLKIKFLFNSKKYRSNQHS